MDSKTIIVFLKLCFDVSNNCIYKKCFKNVMVFPFVEVFDYKFLKFKNVNLETVMTIRDISSFQYSHFLFQ
jgi:hypothetical protein